MDIIIIHQPKIESFEISQTKIGEAKAKCSFTVSNYDDGATWTLAAADDAGTWWIKDSGTVTRNNSATISFDQFREYEVLLLITNSDKTDYEIRTVTLLNVEKWDWQSSNGDASAEQTSAAYDAVTGQGKVSDLSYLVWNDMCAKVREIRLAVGDIGAWDPAYGSYSSALMSASDRVLTASRFNNLKNQIGSQIGTGINDVSTGDIVKGSYFTTLTGRMNDWIDSL